MLVLLATRCGWVKSGMLLAPQRGQAHPDAQAQRIRPLSLLNCSPRMGECGRDSALCLSSFPVSLGTIHQDGELLLPSSVVKIHQDSSLSPPEIETKGESKPATPKQVATQHIGGPVIPQVNASGANEGHKQCRKAQQERSARSGFSFQESKRKQPAPQSHR